MLGYRTSSDTNIFVPDENHGVGSPLIIVTDEAITFTTVFEFSLLGICIRRTETEPKGNRAVRRLLRIKDLNLNDSEGLFSIFLTPCNTAIPSREALLRDVLMTIGLVVPYAYPHIADSNPKAPRRTPYRQQD